MRLFETALVIVNLAAVITSFIPAIKRQRWWVALPILGACLVVAHLAGEGYRWQMLPHYVLTAALLGLTPAEASSEERALQYGALGVWVLGTALALVLPVPQLPEPSGPYNVGTTVYHWTDQDRAEIYGENPGGPREIMVQIWYPAGASVDGQPVPWLLDSGETARAMAQWVGLPPLLIPQINLTQSHAYPDARVSPRDPPYPVILYVHGWGGFRSINLDQLELLASHGYIVASADHTYGALATVFPDGRVAPNDPNAIPERDQVGEDAYQAAIDVLAGTYAADARFVLDQLTALNEDDPERRFTGLLDLERVGFFGHSTGGGAVMQACHDDPRCIAVLGQDTWIEPTTDSVVDLGLDIPALLIFSDGWGSDNNKALIREFVPNLSEDRYEVVIAETQHYDFTIVPLLSPLASLLGLKGPLPSQQVIEVNHEVLLSFFDSYLKGEDAAQVAATLEGREVLIVREIRQLTAD
ncbi:MAG: hypothetical protein GYB68_03340 [Chloroflexi bacterium]|nr:hypothetical protein [Chloroflexota bacterium]